MKRNNGYAAGKNVGYNEGIPTSVVTSYGWWNGEGSGVDKTGSFVATKTSHIVIACYHASGGNVRITTSSGSVTQIWDQWYSDGERGIIAWRITGLTVGNTINIHYQSDGAVGASWSGAFACVI